jgi:hypothetical protein
MRIHWIFCLTFSIVVLLTTGAILEGKEKITVGVAEDVTLMPWGVKLPARIDTGAATSSLDARELSIDGGYADFKLPEKYGGTRLLLPIVDWRTIRSAEFREKRPIVEMEFCLGGRNLRGRVNLNDRSRVKYPLIIGRNILRHNFVVDCMRSRCAPPCPEVIKK